MYYVGMGAPVTHDVSGHRALKSNNDDIGVSLDSFKHALQVTYD